MTPLDEPHRAPVGYMLRITCGGLRAYRVRRLSIPLARSNRKYVRELKLSWRTQ